MGIIELKDGNCQNCYRCIRHCPVKAIEFKDHRATVIDSECILCGECILNCPQNAKYVKSSIDGVKKLISSGKKVYATIAPSWQGYFNTNFEDLTAKLYALGFAGVEETAIGASEVSREYMTLLKNKQMKNIIATACPSVVMLIEKFYPNLIKCLAPVSSPMMAHARLMREAYGDIKVVFIGPCFAKKQEVLDPLSGGLVNEALTFEELETWMDSTNISLPYSDTVTNGVTNTKARLYPVPGGIIRTINPENFEHYTPISVDGVEKCIDLFSSMETENITGLFVEANVCSGACIGGPVMKIAKKKMILSQRFITEKQEDRDLTPAQTCEIEFPHPRVFTNRSNKLPQPTEEQIREILEKTGKYTEEQELNCGSCGYNSCRAKAIAVFQGKADIYMCLPYFRERAESISNTVIAHSPNAIIAFDRDLLVCDLNPKAEELFNLDKNTCLGLPIEEFYDDDSFTAAQESGLPITKKKHSKSDSVIFEQTVIYLKEHNSYIAFIKDITEEEENKKQLNSIRENTIETTQQVINKQMRVAQEIASLLGETTAETKVALTKLKKSLSDELNKDL